MLLEDATPSIGEPVVDLHNGQLRLVHQRLLFGLGGIRFLRVANDKRSENNKLLELDALAT